MKESIIIPFKPMAKKGLDCLEACLLSLTNHYRHEYRAALLQCFNFRFRKNPNRTVTSIGDHFDRIPSNIVLYLKKFYGIESMPYDFGSPKEHFDFVLQCLAENEPVILLTSSYYCSWLQSYHTVNQHHFIILIGITDRKTFICSDPMIMGEHLCEMSYDDFFKGCYRSHRIGRHVIPAIQENEMISLTRNHLAKLDLENSFSKLYHVLSHTQTLIDEYQDDAGHVWSSLLDMNLGYYLTGTHQLYAEYLVFLSTLNNKYRMFIEYANTSITLSKKWNTVRNIIYKSYLKDNYQECLSMLLKEVEQIRDISIALKTNVNRCITSIQV